MMAAAGLENLCSIAPLSVFGPISALRAAPAAMGIADILARRAKECDVQGAVLIDSWDFSKLVAERLRRRSPKTKLFKYVAPQVWGSRPHRAKVLSKLFDGVMTLFEFEVEWFERLGVKTAFVGHPTFQEAARRKNDGAAFRGAHEIGSAPLLAILPGSRISEVRRLLPLFRQTADIILKAHSGARFVIPAAPAVEAVVREGAADWPARAVLIGGDERYGAFAAADAALAASGTVTTELAINQTPMVVAYRLDWASAAWVRAVATTEYVTLLNIAAGREVVPEFLQEDCRPEAMASVLIPLMTASPERRAQLDAFPDLLPKLGIAGAPAAQRTAQTLLDWL
jgi:lipid-A-disaccharide synthase